MNLHFRLFPHFRGGTFARFFSSSASLTASFSRKKLARTSAAQLPRLSKFVNEEVGAGGLASKICQNAALDKEFDNFLKKYRQEKDGLNVVDLSRFFGENNDLKKDQKLRHEEIEMLREFKKRQIEKDEQDRIDKGLGVDMSAVDEYGPWMANPENTFSNLNYMKNEEFFYMVVERGVVTLVTSLKRVNHFRYLIYAGNMKGIVTYGKGSALSFEVALERAMKDCKKNMISLERMDLNSFPREIRVNFNKLTMNFVPYHKMHSWGNPIFITMLHLAGLDNVRARDSSRNWNRYATIYALMIALTRNRSIQTLAEQEGVKSYSLGVRRNTPDTHSVTEFR